MEPVLESENRVRKFVSLLVCDIDKNILLNITSEVKWVNSPSLCIHWAIEQKPQIIVISFINLAASEINYLIELCTILKKNSITKNITILAILHTKHRGLLEDLAHAKVDYTRYIGSAELDLNLILELINNMKINDSPERQILQMCPFINYLDIYSQNELTVCKAWYNRMVLGGRRLRQLCETESHMFCENYLSLENRS
ncbi:MAG: hypothetical protein JW927_21955 [Deltaproteobacteria bacterium]|nr:hypothetical protein [Deltaproteobacteria bacterium]